ncbi:minor tail protein [Propionibacterium phage G4]|uniref:Minor tail protein n=1 Tax=Propionibacterium phage G4 TaxID=1897537 RepID=A0A1D8EUC0_9CAUD|nr:minor tail protein [Propionibacterium phage G4]AOT24610.1 minor tail protein [Propionibacterium phage G4]
MATWDYGYAPADVVTDSAGDVLAGVELRVWDAEVAGKAVAVQQDRGDGWKPVSRVLTDDVGRFRFRAEVGPTVWVEDASGRRWRLDAWQTLGTMIDSAQTAVTVSQAASSTADKALDTATGAASAASSAASSASAAQTAAAASATDAAASAKIATGAQIAANLGNSWWMTGSGTPPTTFDVADGPIVGARFRDTVSGKTWVASQVLKGEGKLTVEWEQIGPLPTVQIAGAYNPGFSGVPIIQTGTTTLDTDASGTARINFSPAFPTNAALVHCWTGDVDAYPGTVSPLSGVPPERTGFTVKTSAATSHIRVNWIAFGW